MTLKEVMNTKKEVGIDKICVNLIKSLRESSNSISLISNKIDSTLQNKYDSVGNFKRNLKKDIEKCYDNIVDIIEIISDLNNAANL